ncbi:MAG: TetR family transcriptional regulator, partial [Alphaproteobacteria bacterium]
MAERTDRDQRVLDGALRLAAREGWQGASLAAIAAEAGVPLLEVYRRYPSRTAVLAALLDRVDEAVLRESRPDPNESARDRLFDVVMRRLDALRPHKDAIAAIARALAADPVGAACLWPRFMRSMRWMLEAAGLGSAGLPGMLKAKGLAVIYLGAVRTWLGDDTADSARTMAAVDRALRRAEAVMAWGSRMGARKPSAPPDGSPSPDAQPKTPRKRPSRRGKRQTS